MDKITPSLSLYQESTVVLWGTGRLGERLLCTLQQLGIHVFACCDTSPQKWGSLFYGVEVISPETLGEYQKSHKNLLVQLGLNLKYEEEVVTQLPHLEIQRYIPLLDGSAYLGEHLLTHLQELYPSLREEIAQTYPRHQRFYEVLSQERTITMAEDAVLLMLPRKTGDMTLMETCEKYEIPFTFGVHIPEFIQTLKQRPKTLKVISAVRDPIARDISDVFQIITFSLLFVLCSHEKAEIDAFLEQNQAQGFMDRFLQRFYKKTGDSTSTAYTHFFDRFATHVLDVTQEPFDKEKGFTILKQEGVEVFLYQLERLNDIIPSLSQWLGVPFTALENANIASEKWIAPQYTAAKENLQFTQEYVDAAYEDAYVQHFYSPAQIEAMKGKWLKNIK